MIEKPEVAEETTFCSSCYRPVPDDDETRTYDDHPLCEDCYREIVGAA